MFSVFLPPDYVEADVKPFKLLDRYRMLLAADVSKKLAVAAVETQCFCPGCGGDHHTPAFGRFGLDYLHCQECGSLFVRSRPAAAEITAFYRESSAEAFWRTELADRAAAARYRHIIAPRLDWLDDAAIEFSATHDSVVDVGTRELAYATAFAGYDRFERRFVADDVLPAEADLSGIERGALADFAAASVDVATAFEVLDRAVDVDAQIAAIRRVLKPGGLLLATGILASGFDIQTLWDKAEALTPPHRLNVLTVEGWRRLAERHGFDVLEFSTPGAFDIITVADAAERGLIAPPRAIAYLLSSRDDEVRLRFQEFLQSAQMSSFGRIALRRRAD